MMFSAIVWHAMSRSAGVRSRDLGLQRSEAAAGRPVATGTAPKAKPQRTVAALVGSDATRS